MNDAAMFRIAATRAPSGTARRMWAATVGQAARTPTCPELPRLDGRLAVVTGATGGIGAEIAAGLARRGAELILPCRNPQRGLATLEALRRELGPSCVVHLVALELSDLATVAAAVEAMARVAAGRTIDLLNIGPRGLNRWRSSALASGRDRASARSCAEMRQGALASQGFDSPRPIFLSLSLRLSLFRAAVTMTACVFLQPG